MNRSEPAHAQQLSHAAGVPAIGLDGGGGQRLLDVTGLHENRLKSGCDEAGMQPQRQWTRLEANESQSKAQVLEELHKRVGVGLDLHFLHNLSSCVDNAHA